MFDTVICLCNVPAFVRFAESELKSHNPALNFLHVADLPSLRALPDETLSRARLVGVTTGVIIPQSVLEKVGHGAYNFHPGPPEYPGWDPLRFALYDNARVFGVTVHAMTPQVDAGAIVGTVRFPVGENASFNDFQAGMVNALLASIRSLAKSLATSATGPQPVGESWAAKVFTRRDATRLCEIQPEISEAELRKRVKAFGSGEISLRPHMRLHGATFVYVPDDILQKT